MTEYEILLLLDPDLDDDRQAEVVARTREQVERLFDGWELVEPGLVYLPQWRPEPGSPELDRPERMPGLAGVGRKP